MFYAASEIIFWILLSALIGGGIGYGLSEAKSVRIGKRLTQSRADAPMERELAIAWDTIEDLNRRLQVAHETIRGGGGASMLAELEADLDDEDDLDDEGGDYIEVEPAADYIEVEAAADNVVEIGASQNDVAEDDVAEDDVAEDDVAEDETAGDDAPEDDSPQDADEPADEPKASLVHTVEQVVPADGEDEDDPDDPDNGVVGTRLADRVASASIGNQVEVVRTIEF